MNYEAKILINKTDKVVEFRCGGVTYIHEAGKKKPYEGKVAYHALTRVNTGLEEYIEEPVVEEAPVVEETPVVEAPVAPEAPKKAEVTREELMKTPWKKLLKMIGKLKKFTPGMNKEQVVDILMNE